MSKWMNGRGLLAATALVLLGCGFAAPAWARTNHAVLVAVTAYPNLPPRNALIGPNNDAALIRDYLTTRAPVKFEPANVGVLATGLAGASSPPTHDNVLAALAAVAVKAEPGDFVYLHFSGHGARQPTLTPDTETDGQDEIFLPEDSMPWDDAAKRIPNALVDDEIGGALDAIRDKGAFVWVVFDACHSSSATRAVLVGDEARSFDRKVAAEDLGIPEEAMAAVKAGTRDPGEGNRSGFELLGGSGQAAREAGSSPGDSAPAGKGGIVAFYAARTVEPTFEMKLPKGAPNAERFGLFTFTLLSQLAGNPNMTYRQLGQSVLQQYAADARSSPTPLFEGELDAPVFGIEGGSRVMQWPLTVEDGEATIPAGTLHRLAPGTKLAILPEPGSDISETQGYLEVESAENLSSRVVSVPFDGKPALKLADVSPTAYARLSEIALDFTLQVARPAPAAGLEEQVALVNDLLGRLAADEGKLFSIRLVEPGAEADLRLAVLRESEMKGAPAGAAGEPALGFLPASGDMTLETGRRPPLVAIDTENPEKLAKATSGNLQKIFRATSLARLAGVAGEPPERVGVEFRIKRSGKEALEPLAEAVVPTVAPKDQVHILAENNSGKPVDINILYVGSDYSISHIAAERLENGGTLKRGLLRFTDNSFGMERMIAVVTQAPPQSPPENLKFLEQGGVPSATRSAGGLSLFRAALADIGVASATRSVLALDEQEPEGAVMMFQIETAPAP